MLAGQLLGGGRHRGHEAGKDASWSGTEKSPIQQREEMGSSAKEQNSRKLWAELPPFSPDPCPSWVASVPAWFCGISVRGDVQKSTGHGPQQPDLTLDLALPWMNWTKLFYGTLFCDFCTPPLVAETFLLLLYLHPEFCVCAHGLEHTWGKGGMRIQDKKDWALQC